jgi:hypothetical protein
MKSLTTRLLTLALVATALGCDKPEAPKPQEALVEQKAAPSAKAPPPSAATHAATASSPAATAAAATAAAPASGAAGTPSSKGGIFTGLPTTASKVPTVAEWGAAPEIKDIPGLGRSSFEIKLVREWLKVTARAVPRNGAGGTVMKFEPAAVVVKKGKDGNVFEFTAKDSSLTSVVFPLIEGKDREVLFPYPTCSAEYTLTATWPKGAPQARVSVRAKE